MPKWTAEQIEEKRQRVLALLADPAWADKSTTCIAKEAGVSWLFADKVRIQYQPTPPEKRTTSIGTKFPTSHPHRRKK